MCVANFHYKIFNLKEENNKNRKLINVVKLMQNRQM